jgi:ATP-binding cassette subfamily D (ALD) long-chain fatty acid import protein
MDSSQGYYRLLNLDSRIEAPDQRIVTDVARFCDALAAIYSNVGKPLIDIIIFNFQLFKHIGFPGMTGLMINYTVTATLLRYVSPSFGKMAAQEAKFEGDFRTAHTRLTLNSEEICFYNGENREKSILNRIYLNLIKHMNLMLKRRIAYNVLEDFMIKYVWSAVGLGVCALPIFLPVQALNMTSLWDLVKQNQLQKTMVEPEDPQAPPETPTAARSHAQSFITNKRLLMSLADAGGRIMYSMKEAAELAGYTTRVYSLLHALHAVREGHFSSIPSNVPVHFAKEESRDLVQLQNVNIVPPNLKSEHRAILISQFSLTIEPGQHLMITGSNGVGKTSIARVIRGLWPYFEGEVGRPKNMFYITQRPYLVLGSLRDQLIYPDSLDDMLDKGITDGDLQRILELVHLSYLPEREGGFDTEKEYVPDFIKRTFDIDNFHAHRSKITDCLSCFSGITGGKMSSQEGRSNALALPDCFIITPSSLALTSVPARFLPMWKGSWYDFDEIY